MSGKYHPYPEYKATGAEWMGHIPKHWVETCLKRYCNVTDGSHHSPKVQNSGEPFISVTDVGVNDINFEDSKKISYDDYDRLAHEGCKPKAGDVLLTKDGTIGRAAIVKDSYPNFVILSSLGLLSPSTMLDNYYLYYYLISGFNIDQMNSLIHGSALRRMTISKIDNLLITIPPLPEQAGVANFLDHETTKIDTLIEKQQQLIKLLKEKRQAVISHAVTKGLNPDAPMRDSGVEWLGDVPEHWDKSSLGFECSVKARLGWKGLKAEEYVDEGYIFLATPNIKGNEIDFENVNFITKKRYDESPEIMLKVGDVLVTKDGSTTGTTNVVRSLLAPTTVNSSIAVLRSAGKLDSLYLYYFFVTTYTQNIIKRMQGGMGVPHLFQADLRKFNILIPPFREQDEIVDYIESRLPKFDQLIGLANQEVTLLSERRTALISAAVTGKIDVRNWQAPEPSSNKIINKEVAA